MSELKIKEVSYSQLKSFGNFQNETLGATAIVPENESAEVVLTDLRAWVTQQLNGRMELQTISQEIHLKRQNIDYLNRKFEKLQGVYDQMAKVLRLHGIEVPEAPTFDYPMFEPDEDLPF